VKTSRRPAAKTAKKKTPRAKSAARTHTITGAKTKAKATKKPADAGVMSAVNRALDDGKAVNIATFDVRKITDVADTMVLASGNSDRHVRSIADRVIEYAKKAGFRPMGIEGERDGEWVLVDLQDVVVHIMLPRVREFYRLENLWDVSLARRQAANTG
jgi:ribosome-associated protein